MSDLHAFKDTKDMTDWLRTNSWKGLDKLAEADEKSSYTIPDAVNSPPHYTSGGIETIDYMEAKSTPEEFRGHLRLTALKYLSRAGLKDDTLKDLKKAQWYINALVEFIEDNQDNP